MRPKVKYTVIYRHRHEYPVSVMCNFFEVSRSGYYDFLKRMGQTEYDAELAEKIPNVLPLQLQEKYFDLPSQRPQNRPLWG